MHRPSLLLVLLCGWLAVRAQVVINEVHYDAASVLARAEFVELHNAGPDVVDLSGWHFDDGIAYTFPPGTLLAPGAFLVLAEDLVGFDAAFNPSGAQTELAHWAFDEASGSVAAEHTGRLNALGQPLTAVGSGGVSLGTPGVFGQAASLDGASSSYFTIPYLEGIQNGSYTLAAWANLADLGRNPILSDWANPWAFMLFHDTGGVPFFWHRMAVNPSGNLISLTAGAWATNQWRHLAVTWDRPAQVARLYVDGVLAARQVVLQPAANLDMTNNPRNFHLGWKQDSTDTFKGRLDEVRVIQGALNAGSLAALHASNTLVRTQPIDLADIVGGGDGSFPGTGSASGINAASGAVGLGAVGGNFTPSPTGGYFSVSYPFVDGVFVPNGSFGPQPITSAGHTFNFAGTGNTEVSYGHWFNGVGPIDNPSLASNLPNWSGDPSAHSLLSAHAQKGITFDLDAIEAAHGGRQIVAFTAVAGDSRPKPAGDVGILVLVDGVERFRQLGMVNTETAIDLRLLPGDRFLTLVATNSGGGNNSDHAYFGDPFLHIEALSAVPIQPFAQYTGSLSSSGERLRLRDAEGLTRDQVEYQVGFPWPVASSGDGPSMELIHPGLDNDLGASWRPSTGAPTPGRTNSVYAAHAAPALRQVAHTPRQPAANQPLVVTVKATDPDGVASVSLAYQVVAPGAYLPSKLALATSALLAAPKQERPDHPAFEDPANWTSVPMRDDGLDGDAVAGDGVYSVTLPGWPHRTLIRYRITATDGLGLSHRAPFADDPSLNFAAFCSDGVPDFVADTRSVTGVVPTTHPRATLTALPVYTLLTTPADYAQCLAYTATDQIPANNFDAREAFNWSGTFVYDGEVYDHIRYRLRQRNDRYGGAGKRSLRFRFNKGAYAQFHDLDGQPHPTPWRTLNSHKMTARGGANWGLHEFANSTLWNLFGAPAPRAHWYHFRVVTGTEEAPVGVDGQHLGDFQGLWLALEDYDSRFLDSHALPKGNLYKLTSYILNGKEVQRYQSRESVGDATDFANVLNNLRPARDNAWLDQHVDWPAWYRYQTVADAVRHYDVQPNTGEHLKNRAWFFRPDPASPILGKLVTLPWDSDTSWGPNYNAGVVFSNYALLGDEMNPAAEPRDTYWIAYRNHVREFRDLVWREEVIHDLLDRLQSRLEPFSLADRDRWTDAPASAGSQTDLPLASRVAEMKNYAFVGGTWPGGDDALMPLESRDSGLSGLQGRDAFLDFLAADPDIPATPSLTYTGPPGFPLNALQLESSPFADPQGSGTFDALEWRVARHRPPTTFPLPPGEPTLPSFEYAAEWLSGPVTNPVLSVTLPVSSLRTNETYRARVRHRDASGRWSHWSAPLELTPGAPSLQPLLDHLVISEIHYNPSPATAEETGQGWESADFEFIEFHNRSAEVTLDLTGLRLSAGVAFDFAPGAVLGPGESAVAVANPSAFASRHGGAVAVLGTFTSGRLNNAGERITLEFGVGNPPVLDFTYDNAFPWPTAPDGGGCSLSLADPAVHPDPAQAAHWHAAAPTPGAPLAYDFPCWAAQFAPFAQREPGDDPDGDGLSNLLEFAYGTDPDQSASAHRPDGVVVSALGGDRYALRWRRNTRALGLTATVEISSNLIAWHSGPAHTVVESVTPHPDGSETVIVRDLLSPTQEPRRYFRLRFDW
jgi:hypothetical protein